MCPEFSIGVLSTSWSPSETRATHQRLCAWWPEGGEGSGQVSRIRAKPGREFEDCSTTSPPSSTGVRAHGIHTVVARMHSQLGAPARFTRHGHNFHGAVSNFRNFQREKFHDKIRGRT